MSEVSTFQRLHNTARQIWRGSQSLPHVGPHKGVWFLIAMMSGFAAMGIPLGGVLGAFFGAVSALAAFGVAFAFRAIDRAEKSDELVRREGMAQLCRQWVDTLSFTPDTAIRVLFTMENNLTNCRVFLFAKGAQQLAEPPKHIKDEFLRILTTPIDPKQSFHCPTPWELSHIDLRTRDLSAHERMEALCVLNESHFPSDSRRIGQP